MADILVATHNQTELEMAQGPGVWERSKRYVAGAVVAVIGLTTLAACDPDGPGSLPDIPLPAPASAEHAAALAPPTDPSRAELNRNIEKFVHYRQMLGAMRRYASAHGEHNLQDLGWFFEQYEGAEQISGVPAEVIMGVHGKESLFSRHVGDHDLYRGPMQMGAREFRISSANIHLPPNRGPKDIDNSHWEIRAAAINLRDRGARYNDPFSIEMALRRYNSGSTKGGISYAREVMRLAYEAGYNPRG